MLTPIFMAKPCCYLEPVTLAWLMLCLCGSLWKWFSLHAKPIRRNPKYAKIPPWGFDIHSLARLQLGYPDVRMLCFWSQAIFTCPRWTPNPSACPSHILLLSFEFVENAECTKTLGYNAFHLSRLKAHWSGKWIHWNPLWRSNSIRLHLCLNLNLRIVVLSLIFKTMKDPSDLMHTSLMT